MPLSAGTRLGPYEVLAAIGKGGMGEVYKARDTRLDRTVAVKVSQEQFSDRFEREARAVAALNHSNICTLHDVGPNYLVMEFIDGTPLKGPLPVDQALKYAVQICDALDAAHKKGITHRDLKPANILVTKAGIKLLDFGLAKMAQEPRPLDDATLTMALTGKNEIVGTLYYMSPEQLQSQATGKEIDARSDIFSFGLVLYEMLTGKRAFEGSSPASVIAAIMERPAPSIAEVAPAALDRALKKCLAKDPDDRWQTVKDLRDELAWIASAPGETAAAAKTVTRHSSIPWIAAAVLAIVAAGFAWLWLRPAPLPHVTRFEIHAPAGSHLALGTPAISPDGRTIAFTMVDPSGIPRIHLRPIDRIETRVLPGTDGGFHPFWSPDGRSLAFAEPAGHLKRIDVAGGSPRDLTTVSGPWHGDWNPNGDILLVPDGLVSRISMDGGPVTKAVSVDKKKGETQIGFPLFLPDGKRFLVRVVGEKNSIQIATLGSMARTLVLDDVDSAPLLAPTPQGKTYLLYMQANDLLAQEFDVRSGTLRGSPAVLVSNIGKVALPPVRPAVGISPAGVLAYQTGINSPKGQLTWFDRSGKLVETLPVDASGTSPVLSPDGSSVAMVRVDSTGNEDIWVTELTRKSPVRLTFTPGRDFSPVWSPDGKRLAYVSVGVSGRPPGVYIVDANDSSKTHILREGVVQPDSWSPNGQYILARQPGGAIALMPPTGDSKPILVGSRNARSGQGRISPDGKFIAFSSIESGRSEVYVQPMPPATGQWKVSIAGGMQPRWRHDSKELFFVSPDGLMAADVKLGPAVSFGVPRKLFQVKDADLSNYDVRADGQQFLVFVPEREMQDSPITVVLNWWAELEK